MKVILISRKHGGSRSVELGRWSRALLSLCCLGLPLGMVASGFMLGQENEANSMRGMALDGLQDELEQQQKELAALQVQAERKMQAMTMNLAQLQARMTRLDALGQHLTGAREALLRALFIGLQHDDSEGRLAAGHHRRTADLGLRLQG